jgi:uncharacterized tellurite resistance protein B-like protein
MFENLLNESDREVLVKTLASLAAIDGQVTSEEVEYVNFVSKSLNVTVDNVFDSIKDKSLAEILAPLDSEGSKKIVLSKLIDLAYADGDYCDIEKQGIREIAKILKISSENISAIETWVQKGIEWTQEGYKLINS